MLRSSRGGGRELGLRRRRRHGREDGHAGSVCRWPIVRARPHRSRGDDVETGLFPGRSIR